MTRSPLDRYFGFVPEETSTTDASIKRCSKCNQIIVNEHSVKYGLCSDHFSSMFTDSVVNERKKSEERRARKRKKTSD